MLGWLLGRDLARLGGWGPDLNLTIMCGNPLSFSFSVMILIMLRGGFISYGGRNSLHFNHLKGHDEKTDYIGIIEATDMPFWTLK